MTERRGNAAHRSRQLAAANLPGAEKHVPLRTLLISLAAMGVAVWAALSEPAILAGYDALSWLLLVVPAVLLGYYRGWQGATRTMVAGVFLLLLVELLATHVWGIEVRWRILMVVAAVLVALGLGLGVMSELLRRERVEALMLAYSDALTGLPNRRLLDFTLARELAAARRGRALSVVLFDVDNFKGYNDRFGHRAGDDVLRAIARVLDGASRSMHLVGRHGGEEFLAILGGEGGLGALRYAEGVRRRLAEADMPRDARVTLSAGVAPFDPSMEDPDDLVEQADLALRRAKLLGKDRVVCEPPGAAASSGFHPRSPISPQERRRA